MKNKRRFEWRDLVWMCIGYILSCMVSITYRLIWLLVENVKGN